MRKRLAAAFLVGCGLSAGIILLLTGTGVDIPTNQVSDAGDSEFQRRLDSLSAHATIEETSWFEPHYDLLVQALDETNYGAVMWIMATHRRAHVCMNLAPFLESAEGQKRARVASLMWMFSDFLHPEACASMLRLSLDDEIAEPLLSSPAYGDTGKGLMFEQSREEAREAVGVEDDAWRALADSERWERLCQFWAQEAPDVDPTRGFASQQGLLGATVRGDVEEVKALLSKGAEVDERDRQHCTPLHVAARWARCEVAEVLIEHGAAVNAYDEYYWTPLTEAAANGSARMVKILLSHGARVMMADKYHRQLVCFAISSDSVGTAEALVEAGAPVEASWLFGETLLQWAAEKGYTDFEKALLERGALVNGRDVSGQTALHYAAWAGNEAAARVLLEHGARTDAEQYYLRITPLEEAARCGSTGVARLLIEAGADPNCLDVRGETPLHCAAGTSRTETDIVDLLLSAGANPNAKGKAGRTPLHYAAEKGCREVIVALLSAGADVGIKDNEGKTPLDLASEKKHEDVVKLLEEHGAKE